MRKKIVLSKSPRRAKKYPGGRERRGGGNGERSMQLTVREVGNILKVPEATVLRWIKQRGLPAQQVGGQYRFNRTELLEWATAQKIKVSLDLFDRLEGEAEPVPHLADALEAGGVHYGLRDTNKASALRALVDVLPLPEGTDRELLLQLFLAREATASTAVGDGIAVPHVRNPIVLNVTRPSVILCYLEKPIDFGALDGQPVHVLFSLISPTVRCHLQLLARLGFALHDANFKEIVLKPGTPEEILAEARRVEATFPTPAGGAGKAAR
jgi:PTS system nitrogen regulatory IIA component